MTIDYQGVRQILTAAEMTPATKPEETLKLAKDAEQQIREHPDIGGGNEMEFLAKSMILQAGAHRIMGNHRQALDKCELALELYEKVNDMSGMATSYVIKGAIYSVLGNNPRALEMCQEALQLNREIGDVIGQIKALNNLGIVYRDIEQADRAIECFEEAYDLSQRDEAHAWSAYHILNNLGLVYRDLEDYDTALDYFQQSLDLPEEIRRTGPAATYCHIGEIKKLLGKHAEARSFFLQALDHAEKEQFHEYIITVLVNLGELYLLPEYAEKSLERAKTHLLKAREMAQESNFQRLLARANQNLALLYEESEDYKNALTYYKAFHQSEEATHNEDTSRRIADLQISYDLDKSLQEQKVVETRNRELSALNSQIEEQRRDLSRVNEKLQRLITEKNEFLGIAAHDLKSPLAVISGYAQVVQDEADRDPDMVKEYASVIEITATRLGLLVLNLLDIDAIESGALESNLKQIDLTLVAEAVLREFKDQAGKKNIKMDNDFPEAGAPLMGDFLSVEQILRNLISNALKFSPLGSTIHIKIVPGGQTTQVIVKDNGPGISESDQRNLFQRFSRLSARPTGDEHSSGLGLYIVKQRVKALGGKVWCESQIGKGAAFIVELNNRPHHR